MCRPSYQKRKLPISITNSNVYLIEWLKTRGGFRSTDQIYKHWMIANFPGLINLKKTGLEF